MLKYLPSFVMFFLVVFGEAGEVSRQNYLQLINQYPHLVHPLGDFSKGEIQIVLDPQRMEAIEKKMQRDVGLIFRDKYWLWINDACVFPSGQEGVYGRILWVYSLEPYEGIAVAVMPVLPNGKIVLNCNFRHATRSWEIELLRGRGKDGETLEALAKRETVEETGMVIDSLSRLGEISPDSGITDTIVPIFLAKVTAQKDHQRDDSEAIEEILFLTPDEIKQAFLKGYYTCTIRGEKKQVAFRDPFLAYAFLLYELQRPALQNPN